jgi:hypothetical protein
LTVFCFSIIIGFREGTPSFVVSTPSAGFNASAIAARTIAAEPSLAAVVTRGEFGLKIG